MRIIVSGGGTGGHIYPAVTIANQIKEKQATDLHIAAKIASGAI